MSDYATPDVRVSPAWAQRHFDDAGVRFIEMGVDTASHEQGHRPGAVAWDWMTWRTAGVRGQRC